MPIIDMNKLDLLRTFVRVTELASFTQAADQLSLPKTNVSDSVKALEALVGARLLHRTTRKVQPTQDGLALYESAKELLGRMEELEGMFRRGTSLLAGRLRVDMPTLVARRVVLPRLGEFLSAHPNLEIEISSTDRRVDLVREGFDCVLRIGGLADSQLIARPLGLTPVVNCASPAYLAQYGTPRTLDDLAAHRIVHYVQVLGARSAGFEYLDHADATGSPVTQYVPMAGAVTVNNADAYEAAALGGLGIIQAPATGVRHDLGNGRLVALLPEFTAAPMPVSLLYASRQVPERVRVFMDWLAELIEADLD